MNNRYLNKKFNFCKVTITLVDNVSNCDGYQLSVYYLNVIIKCYVHT